MANSLDWQFYLAAWMPELLLGATGLLALVVSWAARALMPPAAWRE